jgi:D-glycero-D-manno-heptose 1,7-bisphosphate phosphatase
MTAVFLDRDGVLNRKAPEGEYIRCWGDMEFLPGSLEAVARLAQAGFRIFLVTNQRGLALGRVRNEDLEIMHENLAKQLATLGVTLSGVYICPHDVSENCSCRKPRPGLLLAAAKEHKLDLCSCWMIGDSPSDVSAGRAAGCRTVRIRGTDATGEDTPADLYADTLSDAVTQILQDRLEG